MAESPLVTAPPDIILSIAEYLAFKTRLSLRLVSRSLNTIISPSTLRNVSVEICNSEAQAKRILESSRQPLPGLYKNTQHLTVKVDGWCVSRFITRPQVVNLYTMIEQLKFLNSLNIAWESGYDDVQDTTIFVQEIIEHLVDAVLKATKGKLTALAIKPWKQKKNHLDLPRGLAKFRGLDSLTFLMDKFGWGCNAMSSLGDITDRSRRVLSHNLICVPPSYKEVIRTLIHNNPQLGHFGIEQGCMADFHNAAELFGCGSGQPVALRSLMMKGVDFPYTIRTTPSPFSLLREIEVLSMYSILPLDNLWSTLQAAGTALKKLTTHQVSHSLVVYLASYSGLEELDIRDIEDIPACTDLDTITMFFSEALPRHSSSLTCLSISLRLGLAYLDGWSFTPSLWMTALTALDSLKTLRLVPADKRDFRLRSRAPRTGGDTEDNVVRGDGDGDDPEESDLHIAVTQSYRAVLRNAELLDGLQTLHMFWPDQEWGCGTAHYQWMNWSSVLLTNVVKKLRSHTGTPRVLVLLNGTYDATQDESGDVWRYVPREIGRWNWQW